MAQGLHRDAYALEPARQPPAQRRAAAPDGLADGAIASAIHRRFKQAAVGYRFIRTQLCTHVGVDIKKYPDPPYAYGPIATDHEG